MPFLVYRAADGAQRIFPFDEARRLTIGRDLSNEIALVWDAAASRVHPELARMGSEWAIADDGLSRNGTFVNGERVAGRRRLRDGDSIRLGQTIAVFRAPASAGLEETARPDGDEPPSLTPAQRRVLIALCRPFAGESHHPVPATNGQIADELVVTVDAIKANLPAGFHHITIVLRSPAHLPSITANGETHVAAIALGGSSAGGS